MSRPFTRVLKEVDKCIICQVLLNLQILATLKLRKEPVHLTRKICYKSWYLLLKLVKLVPRVSMWSLSNITAIFLYDLTLEILLIKILCIFQHRLLFSHSFVRCFVRFTKSDNFEQASQRGPRKTDSGYWPQFPASPLGTPGTSTSNNICTS